MDLLIDQQIIVATRAIGVPLVPKQKVQQEKAKEVAPIKLKEKG